jgi:membrane protein YqaA with SNARE-associated domain
MSHYFILAALVLGINLMPAFAPPTWVVLVFYKLNTSMNSVAIIAVGIAASASGRYLLALGTRAVRSKLKKEYVANLEHLQQRLGGRRRGLIYYFIFFVIAPIPSAQLFEAAALMGTPLLPVTFAFMVGRTISYSLYVLGATTVKAHAMSAALLDSIKSPWGIAIQLICLFALYLLMKVDWSRALPEKKSDS